MKTWKQVGMLVLLGSALKLAILIAPRADKFYVDANGESFLYKSEELHRGTTAVELMDGPVLDLLAYQYAPFSGGSLVTAILAIPFFAVFGRTVFALELLPLAFNALTILFLTLILRRWVSPRAATIGGLAMAVATPGYTLLSTVAFGTHVQSNAFAMAIL